MFMKTGFHKVTAIDSFSAQEHRGDVKISQVFGDFDTQLNFKLNSFMLCNMLYTNSRMVGAPNNDTVAYCSPGS